MTSNQKINSTVLFLQKLLTIYEKKKLVETEKTFHHYQNVIKETNFKFTNDSRLIKLNIANFFFSKH